MKVVINAGHTVAGKGTGAVGYIIESIETRKVVNALKRHLVEKGHEVIIANCDTAKSQSGYLYSVVNQANKHKDADLFVSIHFNAGKGTGCEVFTWQNKKLPQAIGVCEELNKLGFRNRGVKNGSHLYVIKNTKAPAVLVEVCFVDTKADTDLYNKLGANKIAQSIMKGILKK